MSKCLKDCSYLALFTAVITLAIWLPHILAFPNFWGLNFESGFSTIYRNFDGLEYIIIAKTFYNPNLIASLHQSLPASYFASHFPGYALLIAAFSPIVGYLKSMLFVSVASTVLSAWAFYFLVRDFKLSSRPVFLSSLFLLLPARWVIVHSAGSSEPLFIFFVLISIYGFMKYESVSNLKWVWLAASAGIGAQITRPPGILLFIAYYLYIHYKSYLNYKALGFNKALVHHIKYLPLYLIPISLLLVFYWFQISLGDFWAYFHSGDNIHLTFPPFQVFNKHQFWVGDIWLEDIIYIFLLGFFGGVMLLKQKLYPLAFFVLTYLAAVTFIVHRDISRYLLPISPFILIAFEKVLTSDEFKIILPIIILAIYLYTQNFIVQNVAPIVNLDLFN